MGKRLASAGGDGAVRLWDLAERPRVGRPLAGHTYPVQAVAFSPDGTLLASAGSDGTVRLWDPATGLSVGRPLAGHTDWVYAVAFSPDGTWLASSGQDRTVRLWDLAQHSQVFDELCARFGPPTGEEWSQYAPGEPLPAVCP
ncbi:MAG TPA: hypothetical protein VFM54_10880 [Micromonosporaceae bacterium]|nr:hypothetical protein [Micromonosporaceae bacterium]